MVKKIGVDMKKLILIVLFLASNVIFAQENIDKELYDKALKLLDKIISIDSHADTPLRFQDSTFDISKRNDNGCFDLPRMEEGKLSAEFFAIFVGNNRDNDNPSELALRYIEHLYKAIEKNKDKVSLAFSPEEVRKLFKANKKIICIGMENGSPLENDFGNLDMFYNLGIRYITLTHSRDNSICDSANDTTETWGGLSPFGKELVQRMNEKGVLIDVSHISDKAFYDVIRLTKAPIAATHSCCRLFSDNVRNLSDDMIRALAKNGGVLQLNFYPAYLDGRYDNELEERQRLLNPHIDSLRKLYQNDQRTFRVELTKLREKYPYPKPVEVDKLIEHIDHVVKLVGVDYVGIGSDFDGLGVFPKGLEDVSKLPVITYHLLKRGYSEEDIAKIVGGNFLRVWEEVEKYSKGRF